MFQFNGMSERERRGLSAWSRSYGNESCVRKNEMVIGVSVSQNELVIARNFHGFETGVSSNRSCCEGFYVRRYDNNANMSFVDQKNRDRVRKRYGDRDAFHPQLTCLSSFEVGSQGSVTEGLILPITRIFSRIIILKFKKFNSIANILIAWLEI